jgi:hypothetical protein
VRYNLEIVVLPVADVDRARNGRFVQEITTRLPRR